MTEVNTQLSELPEYLEVLDRYLSSKGKLSPEQEAFTTALYGEEGVFKDHTHGDLSYRSPKFKQGMAATFRDRLIEYLESVKNSPEFQDASLQDPRLIQNINQLEFRITNGLAIPLTNINDSEWGLDNPFPRLSEAYHDVTELYSNLKLSLERALI
jgi:hypothetical protein